MAVERRVVVLGILFVSVFQCIAASTLIPLIGWSNSDVLRSVKVADNVEAYVVAEHLLLDSVDTVVVFRTTELSFDDIVKFGGSFGGSNAMFGHVEKAVEQSVSSLWTGVTGDFVHALSSHMGISAQTLSEKRDQTIPVASKLLLVELEGFGDRKVGAVMKQLESKKTSYVAFYTSSQPSNSRRARQAGATGSENSSSCMTNYGKVFFDATDGTGKPCMLFCLTKPMNLTVQINGSNSSSVIVTDSITPVFYNTSNSSNVPPTINQCSMSKTSDILQGNQTIGFSLSDTNNTNFTDVSFRFIFPINTGTISNAYKYFWTMAVCVSGVYNGRSFSAILSRAVSPDNPDNELYVPQTNSYACSSLQYSLYTPVSSANDPKGLLNISSLWSSCGMPQLDSNYSVYPNESNFTISLNIAGIQVQPYVLDAYTDSSFDTPYNCEGYFSIPILMGIFSVVVLVLILYLGNVFMFSIRTLDRFDDPRAPTITVDRLH